MSHAEKKTSEKKCQSENLNAPSLCPSATSLGASSLKSSDMGGVSFIFMPKRFCETEIWRDSWFRKLPVKYKELWRYICDNCDNSGVWKIDFDLASFSVGEELNETEALKLFNLSKERIFKINDDYMLIRGFVQFQAGSLSQENLTNLQKNCKRLIIEHIESKGLTEEDFGFVTGSLLVGMEYRYKGKGKEDRGVGKETKAKSIQDVLEYFKELKVNSIEAHKFWDYFESNGWKVGGKAPMKDWKAAVRNWCRNTKKEKEFDGLTKQQKFNLKQIGALDESGNVKKGAVDISGFISSDRI